MKKIFLWGYWAKNFGDDLFLKVYLDQMKEANINTYILTEKKYKKFYEEILYLFLDYPHKYYVFKYFEV